VPKIIGSSLADHRDQVRQRLFESMMQLIVEQGYDTVTLADVAAAAGVGRTAVYNHFPDKESVLLAMADDATERYLVRLRAAMADDDAPLAKLRTFLRMQMTELAGHHTRMAGIGTALSAEGRARIREHIAPMMETLQGTLTDAIAAGDIPEQDVPTVSMMISSITAARFTVGLTGDALDHAISVCTDFVLRGVGAGNLVDDDVLGLGRDGVLGNGAVGPGAVDPSGAADSVAESGPLQE